MTKWEETGQNIQPTKNFCSEYIQKSTNQFLKTLKKNRGTSQYSEAKWPVNV